MSLYGSSPFNFSGYTFTSSNGPKGSQGPTGPQGFKGNPGRGPTGPTGYCITFLNYTDDIVNTVYENGDVRASSEITRLPGTYILEITGTTGGKFSPLASVENLTNQTIIYNEDGDSNTFEFVKRLNFKNIKTNSSPYITLDLSGPPPNGIEPSETVRLTYNVFNLGTSNITGGPDGSLAINNPGNIQSGYTGSTYNEEQGSVGFGLLNVAEQLVVVNPQIFSSNNIQVWAIDPSIGSIFYLKGYKNLNGTPLPSVTGHHIVIKKDTTSSITKAFSVIFPSEFFISNSANRIFYSTYNDDSDIIESNFTKIEFKKKFNPNIIWQADSYFCPSQRYDIVNFISVGSRYIGIPAIFDTALNSSSVVQSTIPSFSSCKPVSLELFYRSLFNPEYGLCCKSDCSCELAYDYECEGYFHQGVTCGGISGPCSSLGACCMYSVGQNIVVPCQELTYCQCSTIASDTGFEFNWNPFTTIKKSCNDFNCSNAKNNIGACCDGIGGCLEETESNCQSLGMYFQGIGVNCTTSDNLNVCFDGNGACCNSGLGCTAGITGYICLSENKTYYGDGTTCGDFSCTLVDIPCYSIIENTTLYPGMEYEDGIVVGIFNASKSKCFGANIFSGEFTGYTLLTGTTYQQAVEYYSSYDYSGYGFDTNTVCENDGDSYILIISKHPINIDSNKTVIDGSSDIHEFIWSNGSVSWGPLVDVGSFTVNEFDNNNLMYKEGYIYDYSNEQSSKLALYGNSFLTCSSARVDTNASTSIENRPPQSFIGQWTRNNGLYNTIRLCGSEFFYYNIIDSMYGATLENYTPISTEITAARALSLYNRQKQKTIDIASNWYIPSIDELAFIANYCRNTNESNLNARLLEVGGTPLSGWHWSSTGALNVDLGEGILTPTGLTHGSEAWAINIDVDGISENMIASRRQRTQQYSIRPIKMIRCDRRYYSNTDSNFKLWNIPILSERIIDNQ